MEGSGIRVWGLPQHVAQVLRPPGRHAVATGIGFKVQGLGSRVQGSGFRVWSVGFRVQGSGYRIKGTGYRV